MLMRITTDANYLPLSRVDANIKIVFKDKIIEILTKTNK